MQKIVFNCCDSKTDKTSRVCTKEWLDRQLDSAEVNQHVEKYRQTGDESEKGKLPMILPHATFTDGGRKLVSAVPSGLVSIDVDDHEDKLNIDPSRHFKEYIEPYLTSKLKHVVMVYTTASGKGFRVIAKRQRQGDLWSEQLALFGLLHGNLPISALDQSCKDLSRASFLTTRKDLLYLNADEMFGGEVSEGFAQRESVPVGVPVQPAVAPSLIDAPLPIMNEVREKISEDGVFYGDVAYTEIVSELMKADKMDMHKGNRNNSLYRLACQLRHICRSEQHILQVLPYSGLSVQEVSETVHSACSQMREGDAMDIVLKRVLDNLCEAAQLPQSVEPAMPARLPRVMKAILEPFAPSHRPAMAMCSLPLLGALGSGARFLYLEDEVHSLSFQSVLVAEQGTGKSSMPKMHKRLCGKLIEMDNLHRQKMDEWRDEQLAKGEGGGTKPPRLPIRNLNPRITFPAFLEMMKNARGQHLVICAPEIDALPANQWLQNGTTLRLAFDNEYGGQDTKSANAVSAYLPFYCNTCMSGTPTAVMHHFKNAEDGLVSRTLFCAFPQERGQKRVADKVRSEESEKVIDEAIDMLMAFGVTNKEDRKPIRLPKIEKEIMRFYEMKGDLYNMTMNESIESFRTRAALIGFRAGALCYLLEGCQETKEAINFARYVAEYCLYYQMKFFGEKLEVAVVENRRVLSAKTLSSNDMIFVSLGDSFSNSEMAAIFQSRGKAGTGVSQTARRWEDNQWVERLGRGQWRKTALGKERAEFLTQSIDFPSVGERA